MPDNKALLVGINYYNTPNRLNGCINDIRDVNAVLLKNNFSQENITVLSDDPNAQDIEPTRENILAALDEMIDNSKSGDILFFHYSGHGTYYRDRNSDEYDGKDEAICPVDGNDILDDEIKKRIDRLPAGVRMFSLMDCCHSGSMFDLVNNVVGRQTNNINPKQHGYAVMLSGCKDNQTSADALMKESTDSSMRSRGAMTASFLNVVSLKGLKQIFDICFSNSLGLMSKLQKEINDVLKKGRFSQVPNISFEGTLAPVIFGLKSGRYNMRQTASRDATKYKQAMEPAYTQSAKRRRI